MGLETVCLCAFGDQRSEGQAQLETSEILFRGEFRLKIPRAEIQAATVVDGELIVSWGKQTAAFGLGRAAEKWAGKILHPPGLLDKLGIKPGVKVRLNGKFPGEFANQVKPIRRGQADLVMMMAENPNDLLGIDASLASLADRGALWIVYPKGRKEIREAEVRAAALGAGLVDVKVASFSDTLTATKWMRPAARR